MRTSKFSIRKQRKSKRRVIEVPIEEPVASPVLTETTHLRSIEYEELSTSIQNIFLILENLDFRLIRLESGVINYFSS